MTDFIPFTVGEQALNRAPFTADLPDSCVVERLTTVDDTGGGQTDTWTDLATVACRVAPSGMRSVEQPIAGRSGLVQFYTLTLESAATSSVVVTEDDRIRHTPSGARFEVTGRAIRSRELSQRLEAVLLK